MRKATLELCQYAVAGLENTYLDNPDEPPITLEEAVDICYDDFVDAASSRAGSTTASFFDKKKEIRRELKRLILFSTDIIKLKGDRN